ncbi:MAG TPA: cbb3-type cytochrome c oxidase subunit I, partial [Gemmatimonadaceae bacterium]|nr:cbb3-type cytochrome c oxidase subunit I [Gemmatimonadaceae bacterium]
VYILILPSFGLVSEVIPTFSRKPLFGYPVMVYSLMLIATLGFGVWAHHMFAVGMGPIADSVFGITTMLIAIPTGVKIFNWLGTVWGGQLRFTTAMLFALGLVGLFTIGGISGVMHSSPPSDLAQTDSYFVVAHFHYVLFGGSMMGLFAGIYYYFPKITGRLMNEALGKVHFWGTFIGMNLTFFPMHFSGLDGMPRRIYRYEAIQGWTLNNHLSTIGAYILGLATLVFLYNLIVSRRRGVVSGPNPWSAPTLEWSMPSPPPDYNFAKLPRVTSRYPMWEGKSAEEIAAEPRVKLWEPAAAAAAPVTEERIPTAEQLGIPMPHPTIKPLIAAIGLTVAFIGLLYHKSLPIMILGGLIFVGALYSWLLTPLEPEVEGH